jgi:citrate synthase
MADGEYRPGLEGVPATRSNISFVDGQAGILEYRGIPIEELTAQSTFLETAYLLIFGKLPTQAELDNFDQAVRSHRRVKYRIRDMIKSFPESGHPMDALQTCVASLGMFYPVREADPDYVFGTVTRLLAKLPTMVAMFHQMRQGNDPIPPRRQPGSCRQFPLHALRQEAGSLAGPHLRYLPDLARRTHSQCLYFCPAGERLYPGQPL